MDREKETAPKQQLARTNVCKPQNRGIVDFREAMILQPAGAGKKNMSCPSWQWHRIASRWFSDRTLPVAPLWCDLGIVPNSLGNKTAENPRPTVTVTIARCQIFLSDASAETSESKRTYQSNKPSRAVLSSSLRRAGRERGALFQVLRTASDELEGRYKDSLGTLDCAGRGKCAGRVNSLLNQ